jgi:hypothetical protein
LARHMKCYYVCVSKCESKQRLYKNIIVLLYSIIKIMFFDRAPLPLLISLCSTT